MSLLSVQALWSFFQITSKLDKVYQTPMPSTVADFFKSLPFVSLNLDVIGPLKCYGLTGFQSELYFALYMPIALVFLILIVYMTIRLGWILVANIKAFFVRRKREAIAKKAASKSNNLLKRVLIQSS